jgi:4a-hydroxytetrahydrobiopterin dehydratase
MNTASLASQRCRPLDGHDPMEIGEIDQHLAMVNGWSLVHGSIQKQFTFDDYGGTTSFVNAVAWIAQREDHHPDIAFGFNRCTLRFNTHSVGGISVNDFICAAKVDALLE